ncbi:MAG: hypothetical protein AAFX06_23395 [Planctomycetota bacterium]
MSESDSKGTTSADFGVEDTAVSAGNPDLSPLEGGRWRPVSPDELLRKNAPEPEESDASKEPAVPLERRQALEQRLKSNPTDLDGFLELAAIYRTEQRPLEAKRLLKQAAQVFPDNEDVRFQLEDAILARSRQQLQEVHDLAQRLNSPEADREFERARSDWACRRIEVCQARLLRDPSQVALRLALAEAKFDAELFEDAYSDAEALLENDELFAAARMIRARSLIARGDDLGAMKELRGVAMRRAVPAPASHQIASLKMLCELAERHELDATLQHYQELLTRAEAAISS